MSWAKVANEMVYYQYFETLDRTLGIVQMILVFRWAQYLSRVGKDEVKWSKWLRTASVVWCLWKLVQIRSDNLFELRRLF